MSKNFSMVPLRELLIRSSVQVGIEPEQHYKQVTVRLWGKGVILRGATVGADIEASKQFLVKANQFILSKIDARNGALGLVPTSLDGAIVSSDFPVFTLNSSRIVPKFLDWMSKTNDFVSICRAASEGTTNRIRLREDRFLATKIPLPPLEEQHRIVTRIEELVDKIKKAQSLHRKAIEASERLLLSTVDTLLKPDQCVKFTLSSLLRESSLNGLSTRPSDITTGIPILRISAATSRQDFLIDEDDHKYIELDEQDYLKYKVEPGDILVCRFNGNLHFVGKFALYKQYSGKTHVYPDKLIRLRVDTEKILPEFLCITVNSSIGRQYIEAFCATTAGNIGISASNLKSIPIPVPSLKEQNYIVECFHDLQSKVDILKRKQTKTSVEIDAILPSILDKAFKGEL